MLALNSPPFGILLDTNTTSPSKFSIHCMPPGTCHVLSRNKSNPAQSLPAPWCRFSSNSTLARPPPSLQPDVAGSLQNCPKVSCRKVSCFQRRIWRVDNFFPSRALCTALAFLDLTPQKQCVLWYQRHPISHNFMCGTSLSLKGVFLT